MAILLFLKNFYLKYKLYIRTIIVVIALFPLVIFLYESPPVKNDFSWKEVITPEKEVEESYNTFKKITNLEKNNSFTNINWYKVIIRPLESSDIIEKEWEKNIAIHNWLKELDSYEKIADLTATINAKSLKDISILSRVSNLYFSYAKIKINQNNFNEASKPLLILNSLFQKSYPYSRTVNRTFWIIINSNNLQNVEMLITNQNCPKEICQQLKNSIIELDSNFESWLISEYLLYKDLLENRLVNLLENPNFLKVSLMKIGTKLLIDKNRALHEAKKLTDICISSFCEQPFDLAAFKTQIKKYKKKPKSTNLIGNYYIFLVESMFPLNYERSIVLNKKRKELIEKLQKM